MIGSMWLGGMMVALVSAQWSAWIIHQMRMVSGTLWLQWTYGEAWQEQRPLEVCTGHCTGRVVQPVRFSSWNALSWYVPSGMAPREEVSLKFCLLIIWMYKWKTCPHILRGALPPLHFYGICLCIKGKERYDGLWSGKLSGWWQCRILLSTGHQVQQ